MKSHGNLIPSEDLYLRARALRFWKPEPGAPWGNGQKPEGDREPADISRKLRDTVISVLREHQPLTRVEIADRARCSISRVQKAMLRMAYENLVIAKVVDTEDKRGRPRRVLSYTLPEDGQ